MEEAVDGGGGQRLGHEGVEAGRVELLVRATLRFS
jgi:hypothetical protein